jgi:hypothetical protein
MRGFEVWGRPETYLNPAIRAASSPWHRESPTTVARVLGELERDLASGEWNRRYGHLRGLALRAGQSLCLVALAPNNGSDGWRRVAAGCRRASAHLDACQMAYDPAP